jgi:TPP-dependent pyruvate/acetoin dehydrogenase alpha subunit
MFNIPVHLALGHEGISEVVSAVMKHGDKLLCTHRNLHYQLARGATLSELQEEFRLMKIGLAGGKCGSMNLSNPNGSIIYTSSILGNNLCVAVGVALSKKIRQEDGVIIATTGDGAMEEGAFYESILNASSLDLPFLVVVENNNWSLASQIKERRKTINLSELANSLGVGYTYLTGNNIKDYYDKFFKIRECVCISKRPHIVEVELTTLGGWTVQVENSQSSRYVNYHAGSSSAVSIENGLIINSDVSDPVYWVKSFLGEADFKKLATSIEQFTGD